MVCSTHIATREVTGAKRSPPLVHRLSWIAKAKRVGAGKTWILRRDACDDQYQPDVTFSFSLGTAASACLNTSSALSKSRMRMPVSPGLK